MDVKKIACSGLHLSLCGNHVIVLLGVTHSQDPEG